MNEEPMDGVNKPSIFKLIQVVAIVAMIIIIILMALSVFFLDGPTIHNEMGFNQISRTPTTVTYEILSVMDGALVEGAHFSFVHYHQVENISNVWIYSPNFTHLATYNGANETWDYYNGTSAETLVFEEGILITFSYDDGLTSGDTITMSSMEAYFGTTEFRIISG